MRMTTTNGHGYGRVDMTFKGLICVGMIVLAEVLAQGQVITGTISGIVKDSSGAVLPGASVQVQNMETGANRTVKSDVRGFFVISNVFPGNYEVTASLAGFQTEVRKGITVNVAQTANLE